MKEIVETLHLPAGDEAVKRFLIKQGYTYKKKSLHTKEQERPRCNTPGSDPINKK